MGQTWTHVTTWVTQCDGRWGKERWELVDYWLCLYLCVCLPVRVRVSMCLLRGQLCAFVSCFEILCVRGMCVSMVWCTVCVWDRVGVYDMCVCICVWYICVCVLLVFYVLRACVCMYVYVCVGYLCVFSCICVSTWVSVCRHDSVWDHIACIFNFVCVCLNLVCETFSCLKRACVSASVWRGNSISFFFLCNRKMSEKSNFL